MSVNKVLLLGRLGADPEVKYTPSGEAVCNFSVATSYDKEHTEWHNIVVWKKQAEACGQYLGKGSQVFIEGYLRTRNWDDRDGNKRYRTEIVAQRVDFIGGRKEQPDKHMASQVPPEQDDIPF